MTHQSPLGTGLVIEDRIRLRCAVVSSESPSSNDIGNEKTLQAINWVEEGHASDRADDEPELHHELVRLDLKLNLLLELVGQLVGDGQEKPEWVEALVGSERVRWRPSQSPPMGATVKLALYLSDAFPVPVEFYAFVEQVESASTGGWVTARYLGMGEPTRDALEKLIFRRHRRRVASSRHPA